MYVDEKFVLMGITTIKTVSIARRMPALKFYFFLKGSTNGKLPFLETEVKLDTNKLHTNVYRKPIDTNLLKQYPSVGKKDSIKVKALK